MKDLRAGAAAYLTVALTSRSGAGSRQRVRRRGSPRCYTQAAVFSNAAEKHGTGAEARVRLRGGPPPSVLIRGGEMAARSEG